MTGGAAATVTVVSGEVARSVARRLIRAIGAGAQLPIDRLDDATLIGDAVLSHGGPPRRTIVFNVSDEGLEIAFGAFPLGGADDVIAESSPPGIDSMIARLADRVWVAGDTSQGEYLHVLVGRAAAG